MRLAFLRYLGSAIGLLLSLSLLTSKSTFQTALFLCGETLVWYAIASLSLRRAVGGAQAGAIPSNALESTARGSMIGLNAGLNLGLWMLLIPGDLGMLLGLPLATTGILSGIGPIARSGQYQTALGWASWLMPMSWPVTALGLLVLVFRVLTGSIVRMRIDGGTGAVETTRGMPRAGFLGGFNLGNFTFLVGVEPTAFSLPGISAHETAHTLNVAAFGSAWHLLGNAIEQNLPPFRRGVAAYAELLAEGRRPRPSFPSLSQWS